MLKTIKKFVVDRVKEHEFTNLFEQRAYPKKDVIDELITDDVFQHSAARKELFFKAMHHNFTHHFKNSSYYQKLCLRQKFDPNRLNSFDDIWDIPFVLSDIFKFYDLQTRSPGLVRVEFTSSGTSGKASRIFYNVLTGRRILFLNYYIYQEMGLADPKTLTNYLMFCVDPADDSSVGTSNSDMFVSRLAPKNKMFFALGIEKGKMTFRKDKVVEQMRSFIEEGRPIRVLGFMHHACEVILAYTQKYGKVIFPKGSYILYGGGWKNFAAHYGPDFDLYNFLTEHTNIDLRNVRDVYSLNEHGIFYLECEHHHKHIPDAALACTRDPRTLARLPTGERGLIHLYTPVFESYPGLSLLTTDYGTIAESCVCGRSGPYISISGRAGITKKTTCALSAGQLINKKG